VDGGVPQATRDQHGWDSASLQRLHSSVPAGQAHMQHDLHEPLLIVVLMLLVALKNDLICLHV
jgi:hypothetical protein